MAMHDQATLLEHKYIKVNVWCPMDLSFPAWISTYLHLPIRLLERLMQICVYWTNVDEFENILCAWFYLSNHTQLGRFLSFVCYKELSLFTNECMFVHFCTQKYYYFPPVPVCLKVFRLSERLCCTHSSNGGEGWWRLWCRVDRRTIKRLRDGLSFLAPLQLKQYRIKENLYPLWMSVWVAVCTPTHTL